MTPDRRASRRWAGATAVAVLLFMGHPALAATFEQVSVPAPGGVNDNLNFRASISADGRFVAFTSLARLVPTRPLAVQRSIYVRDRRTGTTEIASVLEPGGSDLGNSDNPSISADGRYIAFQSTSTLVPQDADVNSDVYVRDRQAGTTELVSAQSFGSTAHDPAISADGRYVAFEFANNVWVRDRENEQGEIIQVSVPGPDINPLTARGAAPSISGDGRRVVFESLAQLTLDDVNPGKRDVYLRDLKTETTILLSAPGPGGSVGGSSFDPVLSADGQVVAFKSLAKLSATDGDLDLDLYIRDLRTGDLALLGGPPLCSFPFDAGNPVLSGDGRLVAFASCAQGVPQDTDAFLDLYVIDRSADAILLIRRPPDNGDSGQGNAFPSLSADGRQLAFEASGAAVNPGPGQVYAASLDLTPLFPAVAADSNGNFLAVWEQADDEGDPAIFARAYDRAGVILADFRVNEEAGGMEPAVAATGPGSFVVVWAGKAGPAIRRRSVILGAPAPDLGTELAVSAPLDPDLRGVGSPAVAANADAPGRYVVVWESFDLPRGFARQDVEGKLFVGETETPFVVAASLLGVPEYAPDVAMAADGSFAVAWTVITQPVLIPGDTAVNSRHFDVNAAVTATAVVNRFKIGLQQTPALAFQTGGGFAAVWESQHPGPDFGVFGRRLPLTEDSTNPEYQVNSQVTGDQRTPDVAADAGGNLLVVWRDDESDSLKVQRLLASGGFVEEELDLGATTSRSGRPPAAALKDGRFVVVYGRLEGVTARLVEPSAVFTACAAGLCASTQSVSVPGEDVPVLRRYAVPPSRATFKKKTGR